MRRAASTLGWLLSPGVYHLQSMGCCSGGVLTSPLSSSVSTSASTFVAVAPLFTSSSCSARQRSPVARGFLACTPTLLLPCDLVALISGCSLLVGVSRHE